jgi:ABC-2 type transport system permease protein
LVVVGMLFVSSGFLYMLVWPNMQGVVEHIRTGTMDFILTKPLNSQWHATLNSFKLESASSIVAGGVLIGYALVQLRVSPNMGQILLFIALMLGGLVILYALLTLMVVCAFWAVETGEVMQLIYVLLETGRYPAPTLPQPMRAILTFIIPIAFITTVPAEVLLGKVTSAWVGWCWVFAAGLLFASTQLWKLGVRRYNSASS